VSTPELFLAGEQAGAKRAIREIRKEIADVYLSDSRAWVIGFSGGKDSTCLLQLVWYSIAELEPAQRHKPVYVVASDTLVETPVIVDRLNGALGSISAEAKVQRLPFIAEKVTPAIEDSFWVNLIGRGYPAPTTRFRWCTERLKIRPINRYILDHVAQHGEVVVVLGARKSESATRAQVIALHGRSGQLLSRHSNLPNAFVYLPIRDLSTDDVWSYLLQVGNPWGDDNHDLLALYRSTQDGECPVVIDSTTQTCGNSRFGCWVCTVVTREQALTSLIEHGVDWLEPLLEMRERLVATQDPAAKRTYRDFRRRNGRVSFTKDGKIIPGPYYLEFCQDLLRQLLRAQVEIRRTGPDPTFALISEAELAEIRRLWRFERQDWVDSLPAIYREETGADPNWAVEDVGVFGPRELNLLREHCERNGVPTQLACKLLDLEAEMQSMVRRSRIFHRIDQILSEEWRSEAEVVESMPPALED